MKNMKSQLHRFSSIVMFQLALMSLMVTHVVHCQSLPTDTLCGYVWYDNNGNGIQDPGESPVVSANVYVWGGGTQQTLQTDASGFYYLTVSPGNYSVYYCAPPGYVVTVPTANDSSNCAFYHVTVSSGQSICGLDFGIQLGSAISGTIFIDSNLNGILDFGEYGIPYQMVQVGSYQVFTDQNGDYSITVPQGVYVVSYTPQSPYDIYSLTTPSSYTVSAAIPGVTYSNYNFGLNIPPGTVNLSVALIPFSNVAPGFPALYHIQILNIGAMPTSANVTMQYDPNFTFTQSSFPVTNHDPSTQTLTWNNTGVIAPGGSTYMYVSFTASTSLALGQLVAQQVSVTPTAGTDIDPSNNTDSLHQEVVGSWDPNNKLSIQTNTTNPEEQIISSINPDQSITYVVNFQNTGTAPAVNVVIVDELSSDLVASSFALVALSHKGNVIRNGNTVNFIFNNIMLPDSNTNEPGSHGYAVFKVNAVNGLPAGHVISDNAAIYFDFNQPVITNYANVTMINPLGIAYPASTLPVVVTPNPSSGMITISSRHPELMPAEIQITDMTGRTILHQLKFELNRSLNLSSLESGMYLLRVMVNGHTHLFRLVLER
jgi:uncharacterized repeat protein (TIGR01451 family)